MWKRGQWIFLVFSAVFFLFLIGLTGYRIETVREGNARQGSVETAALKGRILALRAGTAGFGAPAFAQGIREEAAKLPRLLLLCIRGTDGEILYLAARDRSYLKRPDRVSPDWRGTPSYAVRPRVQESYADPFLSDGRTLILDTLVLVFSREDLYPILRDDLFLCLAFLLVCGIVLLLVSSYPQTERPVLKPAVSAAPIRRTAPAVMTPAPPRAPSPAPEAARAASAGGPIAEKTLFSPVSGLVWHEHFLPRLRSEIERAASFDEDLSLCYMRIDNPPAGGKRTEVLAAFADALKSTFPLRDLLFETGGDFFAMVLPDTDIDQAISILEGFRGKVERLEIAGARYTASLGASSRGGRLVDEKSLLEEAEAAVRKAHSEGGNQVIGFRADPMRFRESLSALER
jgi:diguanylate cyclase (GGDEF)-like protein